MKYTDNPIQMHETWRIYNRSVKKSSNEHILSRRKTGKIVLSIKEKFTNKTKATK